MLTDSSTHDCNDACCQEFTAHQDATELAMTIDVESETVVISYTKNGSAVEEHWRIVNRRSN